MREDLSDIYKYLTADELKVINKIKNAGYTILGRIEDLSKMPLDPAYAFVRVGRSIPPGAHVWVEQEWIEDSNVGLIIQADWRVRREKRNLDWRNALPAPEVTPSDADRMLAWPEPEDDEAKNNVSHPPHYGGKDDPFEVIKIIEAKKLGFHEGNVLKYLLRATHKGNEIEDLEKAAWYLNRLINLRKSAKGSER